MNKITLDITQRNCDLLEELCRACNMDSIDYWGCEGCQIGGAKYDLSKKLGEQMAQIIVRHPQVKELLDVFKAPEPQIRDRKRYRMIRMGGE